MRTPIDFNIVSQKIKDSGLKKVGLASIREVNRLVNNIETESGEKFIRMEMGIPGLKPPQIAIDSEVEALKTGVGAIYPPFDGIPQLKEQISLFVKNFMDLDINKASCFPTVGSMQGCLMAMMVTTKRFKGRNRILFIDPGFPVNKKQAKALGLPISQFDVYNYRGDKLKEKLESYLIQGDVAAIMYSNPNNPSWICFTEKELKTIGELATKYDAVVLEDLAYFGMDFRKDYSVPGQEPFVPTVGRYTNNYILLISSSKSFSLAGQRIGMTAIPDLLFNSAGDNLRPYFDTDNFGYAYIFGAMYALSSGVSHTNQYGLYGLLKAVNEGKYNFIEEVRIYGERARVMKKIFTDNGFKIVYDMDDDVPVGDGFYFTVSYPGYEGTDLVEELMYYGISAISLSTTGSEKTEGLRACVSFTPESMYPVLEERLALFKANNENGERAITAQ